MKDNKIYSRIGERIVKARKAKDLNQSQFSDALKITQSTVSSWERGTRRPKRETMKQISKLLNVTVAWLESEEITYSGEVREDGAIYDEGPRSRPAIKPAVIVHLVGYVGGADGFIPFDDGVTQLLEAPPGTKEGTEAVEIWGDSMAPAFPAGAQLFYSQIAHPIPFYVGRPVIVELADGRKLFKFLLKGSKPGLYSLQSADGTIIETDIKLQTVYPIDMVKF